MDHKEYNVLNMVVVINSQLKKMKVAAVSPTVSGNKYGASCANSQDTRGSVNTLKEKLEIWWSPNCRQKLSLFGCYTYTHNALWPYR